MRKVGGQNNINAYMLGYTLQGIRAAGAENQVTRAGGVVYKQVMSRLNKTEPDQENMSDMDRANSSLLISR